MFAFIMAAPNLGSLWVLVGLFAFLAIVGAIALAIAMRRYLHRADAPREDYAAPKPNTDNPAAFMTASMQAVIQKLRDQEKELETLHKAERERAQQTERLSEAVTRNMPAGLILVSSAGLITSANPAAEAALGVKSLTYRRYTEVFGTGSRLSQLVDSCLKQGRTYRREEVEHLTPSHELRHLGVTISPIQRTEKEISGALCLLSDLTELTVLQKQIQVKENMAALGELSAGIAHEFKNSLATISGYSQMLRNEAPPATELREYAEKIFEQTRALAHVVTEFLKFARPLDLADEPVGLRAVVDRAVSEVAEAAPGVEVKVEGNFAGVSGDEALLRQAVLNLARNAAEAVSDNAGGGRVTIRGEADYTGPHAGQRISITDNGPGIPLDALDRIFLPFYTTKANGTGLGLAVVQKIIVQHGGTIQARNHIHGGAEFIVWLPFSREGVRTIDPAPATL